MPECSSSRSITLLQSAQAFHWRRGLPSGHLRPRYRQFRALGAAWFRSGCRAAVRRARPLRDPSRLTRARAATFASASRSSGRELCALWPCRPRCRRRESLTRASRRSVDRSVERGGDLHLGARWYWLPLHWAGRQWRRYRPPRFLDTRALKSAESEELGHAPAFDQIAVTIEHLHSLVWPDGAGWPSCDNATEIGLASRIVPSMRSSPSST